MKHANRILYATPENHPTYRSDIRALFGIYLPEQGINSDLIALSNMDCKDWEGGELISSSIPKNRAIFYLKRFAFIFLKMATASRHRYIALQVRDMPILAVFVLVLAKLKKIPFLYWMSFPIPESKLELARERKTSAGLLKYLHPLLMGMTGQFMLRQVVLKFADHVFVQSEVMKQELMAIGIPEHKLTPVPMGVDFRLMEASKVEPSPDPRLVGKDVLLYMGTFDRSRKIVVLLEMMRIVLKQKPNAVLVLAGDTDDLAHREEIKQQITELGLEGAVIYTGWLTMTEAWSYAKAAKIGFSPYPRGRLLDSASPTKANEYMALGLPVIANDQPEQSQSLQQSGAGLYCEYTSEKFAEAALTILSDENLRQKMSEAGPLWSKRYRDYAQIAAGVASVYREVSLTK